MLGLDVITFRHRAHMKVQTADLFALTFSTYTLGNRAILTQFSNTTRESVPESVADAEGRLHIDRPSDHPGAYREVTYQQARLSRGTPDTIDWQQRDTHDGLELANDANPIDKEELERTSRDLLAKKGRILCEHSITDSTIRNFAPNGIRSPLNKIQMTCGAVIVGGTDRSQHRLELIEPARIRVGCKVAVAGVGYSVQNRVRCCSQIPYTEGCQRFKAAGIAS